MDLVIIQIHHNVLYRCSKQIRNQVYDLHHFPFAHIISGRPSDHWIHYNSGFNSHFQVWKQVWDQVWNQRVNGGRRERI